MKKKTLLLLGAIGMMVLASCGDNATPETSSEETSTSSAAGSNTLASVLGSFNKNLTVETTYQYLASSNMPKVKASYIEAGAYFEYTNFGSATNKGLINVPTDFVVDETPIAAGAYFWTPGEAKNSLVLGDAITVGSEHVADFRDAYLEPSYVGEHVNDYTAENVFIPKIKNATYGTFFLYDKVYEDELPTDSIEEEEDSEPSEHGRLIQDNTEVLIALSKAFGTYEIAHSFESTLALNSAEFYFAASGSSFTLTFYYTYNGGYDRLIARSSITKVGSTTVKNISDYLAQ